MSSGQLYSSILYAFSVQTFPNYSFVWLSTFFIVFCSAYSFFLGCWGCFFFRFPKCNETSEVFILFFFGVLFFMFRLLYLPNNILKVTLFSTKPTKEINNGQKQRERLKCCHCSIYTPENQQQQQKHTNLALFVPESFWNWAYFFSLCVLIFISFSLFCIIFWHYWLV